MFDLYADLLFSLPLERPFTYRVPPDLAGRCCVGMRAIAPLQGRREEGVVVELSRNTPPFETLDLEEFPDAEPIVTTEQIDLARWMADQYLCAPGEALFKMFPAPTRIKGIQKRSLIGRPAHDLNDEQRAVYDAILPDLDNLPGTAKSHLIHGITGSGKTEIYIHLIHTALGRGRTAMLLVPEISLTVQLIARLREVFGDEIALMHSGMRPAERFASYCSLMSRERRIAVGTRSAIFAPLANPGIIIMDEEHDSSYREHSTPRYDARQIAHERVRRAGGVLIFGSATPRVEICYRAMRSEIRSIDYHRIRNRATGASLPDVRIVESGSSDIPATGIVLNEIDKNYKNKEQSIILLNRRGYAPYRYCPGCNESTQCENCSITLTLHSDGRLVCHYCGHSHRDDGRCTKCGDETRRLGAGTQRLEEYLLARFPDLRLERLDTDSVKGKNVEESIRRLLEGELDILVGTQMIAKGIDAPNVTFVGVLQADQGLHMPDFRSGERTFSLLTQVAGRAGRGERRGRVIFEALNPETPILQMAAAQDYDAFFQSEIQNRYEAWYPPFCRIVRLLVRSVSSMEAERHTEDILRRLRHYEAEFTAPDGRVLTAILGPVPAPIERLHRKYRWHIVLKTTMMERLRVILKKEMAEFKKGLDEEAYLEIDFDAVDLL